MSLHMLTADQSDVVLPPGDARNPVAESLHAMAVARTVGVAARTGVFGRLADGPVALTELATRLAFRTQPLQLMLDLLVDEGLLEYYDGYYELAEPSRRWLDPESPTSVTTYLSQTLDHWDALGDLEAILTGVAVGRARPDPDDEATWLRRTRAEYERARLIADDVAAAIGLPDSARSVLELGEGHGWFAAAMCKRNERLRATVLTDAGAVPIGQEIMWETEMEDVVSIRAGSICSGDLGGPHNAVLLQSVIFDDNEQRTGVLLDRIRQALRRGGVVAIMHPDPAGPAAAAIRLLSLVSQLDGGGGRSGRPDWTSELAAAGFGRPRLHSLAGPRPVQLIVARAV